MECQTLAIKLRSLTKTRHGFSNMETKLYVHFLGNLELSENRRKGKWKLVVDMKNQTGVGGREVNARKALFS